MFQGFFSNISSLFPVSVFAAIALFVAKEIAEIIKRSRERKRKLRAVKLLMADEIERNHWFFKGFFGALSALNDGRCADYRYRRAADGTDNYELLDEDCNVYRGARIPVFHDSQYNKHLLSIAELQESLFDEIRDLYTVLAELEHYRKLLISVLRKEDVQPDEPSAKAFLALLNDDRSLYFDKLESVYLRMTGRKLTRWRLW